MFPNAVDPAVFHPMDRGEARRALGIAEDVFLVAFVGGSSREGRGGALPCAGRGGGGLGLHRPGRCEARRPGLLFCGALDHGGIPRYLAAADAFALPTLNEGCCNAIVEALAMGLPVVSSDRPFNDGLLTPENSIRIDPTDAHAVAAAIRRLKEDPALRARLAGGARQSGAALRISARAAGILKFMEERL